MEELFEFLFGAKGRINLAQHWRSLVIFSVAGLFAAVILFAAAAIAAPLFILMVVIVFIPWLMWGFAIHNERLHDRNKSAWWLLVFYVVPAVLGRCAKPAWLAGGAAWRCTTPRRWQVLRSRSGDLPKLAACAVPRAQQIRLHSARPLSEVVRSATTRKCQAANTQKNA